MQWAGRYRDATAIVDAWSNASSTRAPWIHVQGTTKPRTRPSKQRQRADAAKPEGK
ncbi:MAG TPA: hypothetical protein VFV99_32625 [Kofleriaceae bacterium]|nr:hypothetical protein [Kofleriaceae bacterium]